VSLMSFLFGKSTEESLQIREVPSSSGGGGTAGQQISNGNIKNFQIKAVGFSGESDSGDFEDPEYDLAEIKEACAADSYIAVATQKYSQLIFKAGYSIVSDNDAAAEYIRQRLRFMSFATMTNIDLVLQGVAEDLVKYSNAFLVKSRVDTAQMGGIQAQGVWDVKPVGGYFRIDPTTVKIKRDKNGTVKNYQQSVGNNEKSFKATDVIHFYIDKDGNSAFGHPRISAALEDVKMLRKTEGAALTQIYRYANPITHVRIGIENNPEGWATDQEITDARKELEKVNTDGVIITNERTHIDSIGADGEAMDITKYMQYCESRVFTALNVTASTMGRGGAKQDADSMEEQEHNTVKFYQRQIATFIEDQMFTEMLLEGGYNPVYNEQDIVRFKFEEINLETRIKKETHALNMFQGNLIPFEEARIKIGKDSDVVDEARLHMNMITTPHDLAIAQAKGMGTTNNTNGSESGTQSQRTTSSIVQPSNQHGTASMKVKESAERINLSESTKSDAVSKKTLENKQEYRTKFEIAYKKWKAVRNDIVEHDEMPSIVLPVARDGIIQEFKAKAAVEMQKGVERALSDSKTKVDSIRKVPSRLIDEKIERIVTKVFRDVHKKLKSIGKDGTKTERRAAFDVVEYRIRFLADEIVSKAYWYGYVKACQQLKIPEVFVHFNGSEDQEEYSDIVKTNKFSLDDIPAFHAYCSCKIGMEPEKVVT